MVRLVPLENDVIPMILPRNMHLIKGTWIILSRDVVWLGTGQFRWTIGTNGTIGISRKSCHSNRSTGEDAEKNEFIHEKKKQTNVSKAIRNENTTTTTHLQDLQAPRDIVKRDIVKIM